MISCEFPDYSVAALRSPENAGQAGSNGEAGYSGCETAACDDCQPGTADCNGLPEDGCETSLLNEGDCGACGVSCTNDHGTNVCVSAADAGTGGCVPSCALGYGDCDLHSDNGCESNLNDDILNCGTCGHACPANGGTPACAAGVCGVSSCNPGFGDCQNSGDCSFNLANDPLNCGQCAHVCSSAHATARCNAGVCEADCEAGYGDCNAGSAKNDGCETKLNVADSGGNVPNCGACGALCERRAYTSVNLQQCALGVCWLDCIQGAHDCTENRNTPGCSGKTCGCEFGACP